MADEKPDFVADLDYEDVASDLQNDLGGLLADVLEGGWVDNGIGAYEYWGAKGVDVRWEFEISDQEYCVDLTSLGLVPATARGTFKSGGCDGEHRGRCTRACWEIEVGFTATLSRIKWVNHRLLAWYTVEQE